MGNLSHHDSSYKHSNYFHTKHSVSCSARLDAKKSYKPTVKSYNTSNWTNPAVHWVTPRTAPLVLWTSQSPVIVNVLSSFDGSSDSRQKGYFKLENLLTKTIWRAGGLLVNANKTCLNWLNVKFLPFQKCWEWSTLLKRSSPQSPMINEYGVI